MSTALSKTFKPFSFRERCSRSGRNAQGPLNILLHILVTINYFINLKKCKAGHFKQETKISSTVFEINNHIVEH